MKIFQVLFAGIVSTIVATAAPAIAQDSHEHGSSAQQVQSTASGQCPGAGLPAGAMPMQQGMGGQQMQQMMESMQQMHTEMLKMHEEMMQMHQEMQRHRTK